MPTKINAYLLAGIVVILVSLAKPSAAKNDSLATRIVGGTATKISTVPYLVQIWSQNSFVCGGSLVTQLYVVTAAHCVAGSVSNLYTIVGGATNLNDIGVRRSVTRVAIPAGFSMKNLKNDVAVLKMKPLTGANIKPIALYAQKLPAGMILTVSGWGLTKENGSVLSKKLRTVKVPIIDKTKCTKQYSPYKTLTKSMFCASKSGIKDACSGDSGGPAVCNGKLCGIVSWGFGCARKNFPGVYTSVGAVIHIIRAGMK